MQVKPPVVSKYILLSVVTSLSVVPTVSANQTLTLGVAVPMVFSLGARQHSSPLVLATLSNDKPNIRKQKKKSWRERDRESLATLRNGLADSERLLWTDRGGHNRIVETELTADELADLLIVDQQLRSAEPGKMSHDADWLDLPDPMYGPLTAVIDPIEKVAAPLIKKAKQNSSGPAVTEQGRSALSSARLLDPWAVPVGADLSAVPTLGVAMQQLLSFVGYRFRIGGPGIDQRSARALSMPVPVALHTLRANNLRDALVALAGPGLTVVVDHAQRAVAVDVNPRQLLLITRKN